MSVYDKIAADIVRVTPVLRCERCKAEQPVGTNASRYLRQGWPKCHGLTMTLVTAPRASTTPEANDHA